jgi:c(7)-type cytochrome triheme protein
MTACCVLALLLSAALVTRAQSASAESQAPRVPATPPASIVPALSPVPSAPAQPIPYSHKQHLALGLNCLLCHRNPDPGDLMTFPATALCMSCHETTAADRPAVQRLASYAASKQPVPWVRVYQLPDYVYWSHATHLAAGIDCAVCHGPVAERDAMALETAVTTMKGCTACHEKRQVFTDCGDCHEPRR